MVASPQQFTPPEPKQNVIFLFLIVAAVLLIGFMGYLAIQNYRLQSKAPKSPNRLPVSLGTQPENIAETLPTRVPKQYAPETANWQVYTAGNDLFTLRYPAEVVLQPPTEIGDKFPLYINVKNLANYNDEEGGFDKTSALSDKAALDKNEFGSLFGSAEAGRNIINIRNLNGKTFTVLRQQYVCDIQFSRYFVTYKNNQQIIIRMVIPNKVEQAKKMPAYFDLASENCAGAPEWKAEDAFMADVIGKKAPAVALSWYTLFDKIVGTIDL